MGQHRVWLDEHTWYYELPPELMGETEKWQNGRFFEYVGQQTYPTEYVPIEGEWVYLEEEPPRPTMEEDPEAYFGVGYAEQVDEFHRRWLLTALDMEAIREFNALFNEEGLWEEELSGPSWMADDEGPLAENAPPSGWVYVEPMIWTRQNCIGTDPGDEELGLHHSDNLGAMAAPLNERARKVVMIRIHTGTAYESCSGAIINPNTVLTAAHCVLDNSLNQVPPEVITVCTLENLTENATPSYVPQCKTASYLEVSPHYTGPGDADDDYALIGFMLNFDWDLGDFLLSSNAPSAITGQTHYHRGYPGYKPECIENEVTNSSLKTNAGQWAMHQFGSTGECSTRVNETFQFNISSGAGMSGGPMYYCPNGSCDDGAYITSLLSYAALWACGTDNTTTCAFGYQAGPQVPLIRDWLINSSW